MNVLNVLLARVGLRMVRIDRDRNTVAPPRDTTFTVGGQELIVQSDSPLLAAYRVFPNYMAELGRIASMVYGKYPGMTAVDVGAHVGDTASIIRSGCPAPIVCIEGDPSQGRILAMNAARIGGVTVKPLYLSDRSGRAAVTVAKAGSNSTLLPPGMAGLATAVEFATLDEALQDTGLERIKLLKIDTEGFDPKVLRGSERVLRTGRPAVIFEHNRENLSAIGEDDTSSFLQLERAGYDSVLLWDAFGRLILGTRLSQRQIVEDLHAYVGFDNVHLSEARYVDVCVFHSQDEDIAARCLARERLVRDARPQRTAQVPPFTDVDRV
jgi:FkbM family methyltransferase